MHKPTNIMTSEYDSHGFQISEDCQNGIPNFFSYDETGFDPAAGFLNDEMAGLSTQQDGSSNYPQYNPPVHACQYCGQGNPECVAMCGICNNWFCNGSTDGSNASHLVRHLVRSKHKEVVLHKDSPLEGMLLECYNCSCKNVFILGFVPAKGESVVLLLCRNPCAYQHTSKDATSNFSQWEPIISDKKFIPWLVKVPKDEDLINVREVTGAQIAVIDDYLRVDQNMSVTGRQIQEDAIMRTQLRYSDPNEYMNIYVPLIDLETEFDKKMKESQMQSSITIRYETNLSNKRMVFFTLPQTDSDMRLMQGDDVKLTQPGEPPLVLKGNVFKIPNNYGEEVGIELKHGFTLPESKNNWTVEFVWKATSFDRMKAALKSFVKNESGMSDYIRSKLLGASSDEEQIKLILPKRFSAPGLPELNHSQVFAIKMALQRPLSLIQGPPGTGKTVTSATLVYHIIKQCGGQVLVCAPSNIAVDQLADKINRTGLKVVRICAKSREAIDSQITPLTLHSQINYIESIPEFSSLRKLKEDQGVLADDDSKRYRQLRTTIEKQLISNADVVCTTCIGAGDLRIRGIKFRCVLLDESTQATEPECLVSIVHGVRQLVLVGDHCQLGPVIMCKRAANAGLSRSLFERLIELGIKPFRLQVQYRMHPALSEFSSNAFYEGTLQNGVTVVERSHPGVGFPWPVAEKPMFFYATSGREEISSSGTSFLNRTECAAVEMFTTRLLKSGVKPSQIGIITPYEGQRAYLVSYMQHSGHMSASIYQSIEVASVDAFQGREKDYIIMSCVRSNDHYGIGFLNDSRRLNVAITRAKFGLIIVGNPRVLSKHGVWMALLNDYKEKGLLVEGNDSALKGPINDMRPAQILLARVPKHQDAKPQFNEKGSLGGLEGSRSILSKQVAHDHLNVLLPIDASEMINSSTCPSIPLQLMLSPFVDSKILNPSVTNPEIDGNEVVEVDGEKKRVRDDLKNDLLEFAKNFASFNLPQLINQHSKQGHEGDNVSEKK